MKQELGPEGLLNNRISVYIDSYDDKILSGTVEGYSKENVHRFRGLFDLLLFIEGELEKYAVAEPYTGYKEFAVAQETERAGRKSDTDGQIRRGGFLATFYIKVLFRQNASWQGTVLWQEGKTESHFRSALELVFLMDSAVGGKPLA